MSRFVFCLFFVSCFACNDQAQPIYPIRELTQNDSIVVGAENETAYLNLLSGKSVGVVANQTSVCFGVHLVDHLLSKGVSVKKVFAPEHGFRGDAEAGAVISDSKDPVTGLPLVSLYGKNKKPTTGDFDGLDVIVFDMQDVGARFYTYLSTLHYVMEAAAEQGKVVVVLDRPNPNGFYVDGPVLDKKYSSFVGLDPIPAVHGCTLGEMAQMINGEKWLAGGMQCDLKVVPCKNYRHDDLYTLPIKPSPNLPDMAAVYLYPSLCFFEGTIVSVGRGTDHPFTCIGYPGNKTGSYAFTPKDIPGVAMNPPHKGVECTGHDLSDFGEFYFTGTRQLYLEWLVGLYQHCETKDKFFSSPEFFDKLAGSDQLRLQVTAGRNAEEIRQSWKNDLDTYKIIRKKYLLYPDFE